MINIEEPIWTWKDFIQSNISKNNKEISQELENILIDYIKRIESYPIKDKPTIEISFQSKISMSITLLKTFLKNDKCLLTDLRSLVEYTLFWSFITHIHQDSKEQFQNWWRSNFHNIPKDKSV
jgi:hypothetical protein